MWEMHTGTGTLEACRVRFPWTVHVFEMCTWELVPMEASGIMSLWTVCTCVWDVCTGTGTHGGLWN